MLLIRISKSFSRIQSINLEHGPKGTYIQIKSNIGLTSQLSRVEKDSFILTIINSSTFGSNFDNIIPVGYVKHIGVSNVNQNVEIKIKKKNADVASEFFYDDDNKELVVHLFERDRFSLARKRK